MNGQPFFGRGTATVVIIATAWAPGIGASQPRDPYNDLIKLFEDFVAFDPPPLLNGAPDYTAASIASRRDRLNTFQTRLTAIDSRRWPVDRQVDYAIVQAEMAA